MENEQMADQILAALQQLLQAAGPEWVMAFLEAGMEEVSGGGGEMDPMSQPAPMPQQGAPMGMPPAGGPRNALSGM